MLYHDWAKMARYEKLAHIEAVKNRLNEQFRRVGLLECDEAKNMRFWVSETIRDSMYESFGHGLPDAETTAAMARMSVDAAATRLGLTF